MYIVHWRIFERSLEVELPTIWPGGKAEVGRVREEKRREEKRREEKRRDEKRGEERRREEKRGEERRREEKRGEEKRREERRREERRREEKRGEERRREEKRGEERRREEKRGEERRREEKRGEERRDREKNKSGRVGRKKIQVREKVRRSRNTMFFQWIVAPEGGKVGSLKPRVRSHLAIWEMENCTPLWREAHLQVKKLNAPHVRNTFGSCDVEKVHAVLAQSTFPSQNVQNTPASEHFWKLRCRKSARRCGTKHISKSKC